MAAHHSWATLPSIIIVEILSYLTLTDRLNTSAVCTRWRGCLFHPSLWRSLSLKLKHGHRHRAKHLADMCGKYVREVVIEFNSKLVSNVRECLRILDILSNNVNLQKIVLRPQSCQIEWPEREPSATADQWVFRNHFQISFSTFSKLRSFYAMSFFLFASSWQALCTIICS